MGHLNVNELSATKVLIVDDEIHSTLGMVEYLKAEGFRPSYACNGQEALNWIGENGNPDIILLDLDMPVMTGQEFMEAYAGDAAVIVTTGTDIAELPKKPVYLIHKPYNPADLKECIDEAVRKNGGPKWAKMLPCEHTCVGVEFEDEKHIALFCLIPGCEKRKVTHTDTLDFRTTMELALAIYEDAAERKDKSNLS